MKGKYDRALCIELLTKKQEHLQNFGLERLPQRGDFLPEEVVAIKAFLGAWPRALEASGIKPPRCGDRLISKREKRIRTKTRLIQVKSEKDAAVGSGKKSKNSEK